MHLSVYAMTLNIPICVLKIFAQFSLFSPFINLVLEAQFFHHVNTWKSSCKHNTVRHPNCCLGSVCAVFTWNMEERVELLGLISRNVSACRCTKKNYKEDHVLIVYAVSHMITVFAAIFALFMSFVIFHVFQPVLKWVVGWDTCFYCLCCAFKETLKWIVNIVQSRYKVKV